MAPFLDLNTSAFVWLLCRLIQDILFRMTWVLLTFRFVKVIFQSVQRMPLLG